MLSSKVKCPSSKREGSPVYQVSPPYRIAPSEKEIMKEIIENGPVQGSFYSFEYYSFSLHPMKGMCRLAFMPNSQYNSVLLMQMYIIISIKGK